MQAWTPACFRKATRCSKVLVADQKLAAWKLLLWVYCMGKAYRHTFDFPADLCHPLALERPPHKSTTSSAERQKSLGSDAGQWWLPPSWDVGPGIGFKSNTKCRRRLWNISESRGLGIFSVCSPFLEMRLSGPAAPGSALAPLGEVQTADFAEAPKSLFPLAITKIDISGQINKTTAHSEPHSVMTGVQDTLVPAAAIRYGWLTGFFGAWTPLSLPHLSSILLGLRKSFLSSSGVLAFSPSFNPASLLSFTFSSTDSFLLLFLWNSEGNSCTMSSLSWPVIHRRPMYRPNSPVT